MEPELLEWLHRFDKTRTKYYSRSPHHNIMGHYLKVYPKGHGSIWTEDIHGKNVPLLWFESVGEAIELLKREIRRHES